MSKFAVFDTETSGLPKWNLPAEHPDQPHVASLAIIFLDETLTVEREFLALVKPDGWEMEAGAMAVNGLTMERLHAEGRPIMEILTVYAEAVDAGYVMAAHNAQFDCKMMRGELRRHAMAMALADGRLHANSTIEEINALCEPAARFEKTLNVCTMRATGEIMKLAPTDKMMAAGFKKNKPPKLSEAYQFFFGKPLEGAHTAMGDTLACAEILRELHRRGVDLAGAVHYAKEGTKSGEALAARQTRAVA